MWPRLRKAIITSQIAVCNKREATQLATISLALRILHQKEKTKIRSNEELDIYKREESTFFPSMSLAITFTNLLRSKSYLWGNTILLFGL